MSYIKLRSWHRLAIVDDAGWHTRCGRTIKTETTPTSPTLPYNEPSCEACFRLAEHDVERQDVANDVVPE